MSIFDFLKRNSGLQYSEKAYPEETISGHSTAERVEITTEALNRTKKRFIAFDVETTGLSPEIDRIIELGAILFVDGIPIDRFSTLINPGVPISASASSVNHITNNMIANAPREKQVYRDFIEFLGDALSGKTYMCAHNASFDFDFLCNTLSRLGYNAHICYLDTLSLSRKYIKGLENYKQATVAQYYGLFNSAEHRAEFDAEICGNILYKLLASVEEIKKEEKIKIEKTIPTEDELEVCAVIQKVLIDAGKDISWLGFRKNSSGYVEACCLYTFLRFRFFKKGKYIILNREAEKARTGLPCESCSSTEGGTDSIRVYFTEPKDIEPYKKIIIKEFVSTYKALQDYMHNGSYAKREVNKWLNSVVTLSDSDILSLISRAESKKYTPIDAVTIEPIITRDMVVVSAVNNRCPLSQIKNLGDWDKGYKEGSEYYYLGEEARKQGQFDNAIDLYDKARFYGYEAPALYDSYAMTYHKMKDYDNEIVIIEEFLSRETYGKAGKFEARKAAAIKALYAKQEKERIEKQKTLEKERKEKRIEENVKSKEKAQRGRPIIQLDDEDNVIAEYESLSLAAESVGISSKSIRDAATGVQKHAGGYCWKYKDQKLASQQNKSEENSVYEGLSIEDILKEFSR